MRDSIAVEFGSTVRAGTDANVDDGDAEDDDEEVVHDSVAVEGLSRVRVGTEVTVDDDDTSELELSGLESHAVAVPANKDCGGSLTSDEDGLDDT